MELNPFQSESSKMIFSGLLKYVFIAFLELSAFALAWIFLASTEFEIIIGWMIFSIMGLMAIVSLGVIIYQQFEKKQTYLITNCRIAKIYPRDKFIELKYGDIGYLYDGLTNITIYYKTEESNLYYTGNETEYIKYTIGIPHLIFKLGVNNHFIMLDLLINF